MRFQAECAGGFRRLKRRRPRMKVSENRQGATSANSCSSTAATRRICRGGTWLSERGSREAGYLRQPRWQLFATRISPGPKRTSGSTACRYGFARIGLPHRYLSRCPRRRFRREPPRATLQSRRSMFEVAIKAAQENAGSGPLTAGWANAPFFGPILTRGRSHEAIYASAPNARSSGRPPLGGTRTRRTCRLSQPHFIVEPCGHHREGSDIVHSEDQPTHTPRHRPPAPAGERWVRER